jgi:hypothetical protein
MLRDRLKLVKWIHFEGYETIAKGFLLNMCETTMKDYKHYTLITSISLL